MLSHSYRAKAPNAKTPRGKPTPSPSIAPASPFDLGHAVGMQVATVVNTEHGGHKVPDEYPNKVPDGFEDEVVEDATANGSLKEMSVLLKQFNEFI